MSALVESGLVISSWVEYYADPREMDEASRCYQTLDKTGGNSEGSEVDPWKMNTKPTC